MVHPGLPLGYGDPKFLDPSTAFPCHHQETGLKLEQLGYKLMAMGDASIIGNELSLYATRPATENMHCIKQNIALTSVIVSLVFQCIYI